MGINIFEDMFIPVIGLLLTLLITDLKWGISNVISYWRREVCNGLNSNGILRDEYSERGHVLIFNQKNFFVNSDSDNYIGRSKDEEALTNAFENLHYKVELFRVESIEEISKILKAFAEKDHANLHSIVVVVMSLGKNGILYAKDRAYDVTELQKPFTPDNCPSLAGKPKLFFIQACCTTRYPGYEIPSENTLESWKVNTLPIMANVLVMYVTSAENAAWRSRDEGSPFVQSLEKQFTLHNDSKDLLSILTSVNRDIEEYSAAPCSRHNKQVCFIQTRLTEPLFLH